MTTQSKEYVPVPSLIEGKYTETKLLSLAKTYVANKASSTIIFSKKAEEAVPKFDYLELKLGTELGRGGFCEVNEILEINIPDCTSTNNIASCPTLTLLSGINDTDTIDPDPEGSEHVFSHLVQDRTFMSRHYLRGETKDCRYAIKMLKDSNKNDASTYINGVVDLVVEVRFLSVLHHANIIKMRAVAGCDPFDGHSKFFIVLDRLYDTLTVRIRKWRNQQPTGIALLCYRSSKKAREQFFERLTFAYDLACALKYLHDQCIMYRDIKPDNVGFDVRGDIKLFDFGLAKQYNPEDRQMDGMIRNLTGDTGSPRYMDPLVLLSQPYNELCDVYSFCILLWEMMQLSTPYGGLNITTFTTKVVKGALRPKINTTWSKPIQELLMNGFSDIHQRKSMTDVCDILRAELSLQCGIEGDKVTNDSRGQLVRSGSCKSLMSAGNLQTEV